MRKAKIRVNNVPAGVLTELDNDAGYSFEYFAEYAGPAISLTMPINQKNYHFKSFPPFFDGLLPEGSQLEALLRHAKLDRYDHMGQLIQVGADFVGTITVEAMS